MRSERRAGARSCITLMATVKTSEYCTEYGGKPTVVYKQESDKI